MKERKVSIIYTRSSFAAREGAKAKKVPLSFAIKMVDLGVAKIVGDPPVANIDARSVKPDRDFVEDYIFSACHETIPSTKIVYVGRGLTDKLSDVGRDCGIKVWGINPRNYGIESLLLADGIILSSNIADFESAERNQIKAVLFQKSKPFVFRAIDIGRDTIWLRHCFERSALNCFSTEKLFDEYIEVFDESVTNYYIEDEDNYHKLWKKIEDVFGKNK